MTYERMFILELLILLKLSVEPSISGGHSRQRVPKELGSGLRVAPGSLASAAAPGPDALPARQALEVKRGASTPRKDRWGPRRPAQADSLRSDGLCGLASTATLTSRASDDFKQAYLGLNSSCHVFQKIIINK